VLGVVGPVTSCRKYADYTVVNYEVGSAYA
jgi:hypothetical protein